MEMAQRVLSRRTFLAGAGLTGAAVLLAACGSSAAPATAPASAPSAGNSAVSGGKVKLPTYVPNQQAKPDLPGGSDVVQDGYKTFPKTTFKSVPEPPLQGGEVSSATVLFSPVPNAMDSNPAWQAVNKAVGGTMKVLVVPYADYNTRFAAMTAANDLPEIFW
ncbi:MAG: twin-arginine translocation signal domain-containing protein, partial [Chloroflexi bacterium]|nr:twin-arginine translocation signal domain-containing protein [Chloroflexota bacterium]